MTVLVVVNAFRKCRLRPIYSQVFKEYKFTASSTIDAAFDTKNDDLMRARKSSPANTENVSAVAVTGAGQMQLLP